MRLRNTVTAAMICAATNANAGEVYLCRPCDAGKYSNMGDQLCTSCSAGTYAVGKGNTSCTSCPAGQYQDAMGQTGCKACGAGTYQPNGGQASCAACKAGTYAPAGATSCTSCPAGQYQNATGQGSCAACPAGQYQPSGGQTGCAGCAGTVYNNMRSCCPSATNYWNGSSCVAWVNCGANATRQGNNTCSCNGGYNYNGGSGVPAGVACVPNCTQTGWAYTGEKRCNSSPTDYNNTKNWGYCWCRQTRNSCGTGSNEQWEYKGYFIRYTGPLMVNTDYVYIYESDYYNTCPTQCSCQ
jgi:hypothetical protein